MIVEAKFDRAKLALAVAKAGTKILSASGAYIRKVARSMVKKTASKPGSPGKPSDPGAPPHTRGVAGRNLKQAVIFGVEKQQKAVFIGPSANVIGQTQYYHEFGKPQKLKGKRKVYRIGLSGPIRVDGGPVFAKLNTDEQVSRATELDKQIWTDSSLEKTRNYPVRPLMGPAFEKALPYVVNMWKNAVKG